MLTLNEWLKKIGFRGNPFASKQADEEGELLEEYFVAHPSYNAILDDERPRSSILHAPRGAGKSSTRHMFERRCRSLNQTLQALIIPITDWMPIADRADLTAIVAAEHHVTEVSRRLVLALAQEQARELTPPPRADLLGQLGWLCVTYGDYLTPTEQDRLEHWGLVAPSHDYKRYRLDSLPLARRMEVIVAIVRALGYQRCYVLMDGIDELLETAANWQAGANLIEGLLANLRLMEVPGLAFKLFVPTEIVSELQQRGRLRDDRMLVFGLDWNTELLQELLHKRLEAFSDQRITTLDQLVESDLLANIESTLAQAADGSPRALLNLGEWVFQHCAAGATDQSLLISAKHVQAALEQLQRSTHPTNTADVMYQPIIPPSGEPSIPLLRVLPDGRIFLGATLCETWHKISPMQRRLLNYLYAQRGRLCSKDELIDHVWADRSKPADDDSLRKLIDRLMENVEPDPKHPRYFHAVPGFIQLLHTAEPDP